MTALWPLLILVAQSATPPPAVPIDPVAAIVDAFRTHRVVALPDPHGNQQAHALLLTIVRDPRRVGVVDDIVVTFGNARYQDAIDRFVLGEAMPLADVRRAWRETTAPNLSPELPTHEEFFRAVRAVNAPLTRNRRLRVLLADPPIEWERVQSRADYAKWREMHATFAADLIKREVIDKGRRALLLAGFQDLQRLNAELNYDMRDARAETIVSAVERRTSERVFVVWGADETTLAGLQNIAAWRAPSIAMVRNTALGAADFQRYWSPPRVSMVDGKIAPVPREHWQPRRAEEQFDAVLYLGPAATMTEVPLSREVCSEPGYVETRLERMLAAGIPKPEVERLRKHCDVRP